MSVGPLPDISGNITAAAPCVNGNSSASGTCGAVSSCKATDAIPDQDYGQQADNENLGPLPGSTCGNS